MKLSQTSFISFLLSFPTILLFYAMNKIHILILSLITFTCFSCQKQNPKTQLEEIAINFCESFYNFNYPVAEEWSTPSSLSYLSFLASNIQQNHLDQLKTQGAAKASIITSSEITPDSEMATVICQIKNAFIINPINGKAERFSSRGLGDVYKRQINGWLERISHCKMESKITTKFRMNNRKMLFFSLKSRINSLHTSIKTKNKEV